MKIRRLGESALIVDFQTTESLEGILAWRSKLESRALEGVYEILPSYQTLTVYYDPLRVSDETLTGFFLSEEQYGTIEVYHNLHEIPVCYEESCSPDLDRLARSKRVTVSEVVDLHTAIVRWITKLHSHHRPVRV